MADESKSEGEVAPDVPEAIAAEKAHRGMDLMQLVFELTVSDDYVPDKAATKAAILKQIEEDNMAPLYEKLAATHGWAVDTALLERMRAKNEADAAASDASIAEAREKFGEVEVFDRQVEKAQHYARIGDMAGALRTYGEISEKHISTGQKVDIAMAKARLALQHGDFAAARERITEAKALNEKGGDWDRRNRLKVYEGLWALTHRDFATAGATLLDSVATFTAHEVVGYRTFVFYAVLAGLKTLERPALKKRVVDSPDVLSSIEDVPHLGQLLNAFYEGRYRDFLQALADIYPAIARDRYMSRHAPYYLREMRLAAYSQFLQSYKSVTLAGMARTFGVSAGFLDAELSRFIASGRIPAKIDAVSGIVETSRPDSKNAQYLQVLKQGDALLNKVQKLSRVVAV